MNIIRLFLIFTELMAWSLFFTACQNSSSQNAEKIFVKNCGACHLAPNPANLPKSIWTKSVLPEMGARLGIRSHTYDPMNNLPLEEKYIIMNQSIYPTKPLISKANWDSIQSYILKLAPDSLNDETHGRKNRINALNQFKAKAVLLDSIRSISLISSMNINSVENKLSIGNASGELWDLDNKIKASLVTQFESPVATTLYGKDYYHVLSMGQMHPTDLKLGKLWEVDKHGDKRVIIDQLQRPVFMEKADLNKNDQNEYVICEFGNRLGQISLLFKEDNAWKKKTLLSVPGFFKVYIEDLNGDGMLDIVAGKAQGNEGIFVFYQKNNLNFEPKQVVKVSPLSGTSDFVMIDFNKDGFKDLITVNGDNADLSPILKPYHGVRVYLNDQLNNFNEFGFYPIYGATQVEADDFDGDGDVDIAVSSFFAEFEHLGKESFVYLENVNTEKLDFIPYSTEFVENSRWILMEKYDYDQDNDLDLILGAFTYSPDKVSEEVTINWLGNNINLLILENVLND